LKTDSALELVQRAYQAFSRGDRLAMLETMATEIEWDSRYPAEVPFQGVWKGHAGVLELLERLNQTLEVLAFEIREIICEGRRVVVLGSEEARVKSTGRTYRNEWVHVWMVEDGTLARMRNYNDTSSVAAAFADT
jgi:uncharacterized protein